MHTPKPTQHDATRTTAAVAALMDQLRTVRSLAGAPTGLAAATKRLVIKTLVESATRQEPDARRHARTVRRYSACIARQLGLDGESIGVIKNAAMVHDVGKIGIDGRILNKPGRLTADEVTVVRRHPRIGADMLACCGLFEGEAPLVLHHHERFDGQGYPDRLCGEHVPLGARVLGVADALDAMLTPRSYKPAFTIARARHELMVESHRQFDPAVVDAALLWLADTPLDATTVPASPDARTRTCAPSDR